MVYERNREVKDESENFEPSNLKNRDAIYSDGKGCKTTGLERKIRVRYIGPLYNRMPINM